MKKQCLVTALMGLCFLPSIGRSQGAQDRGAILGGITGALAGAAIGDNNDEAAAGALIGGAVGLITGSAIGSAKDREAERVRAYHYNQQMVQLSRAVAPEDVVTMTRNGVSDHVIINHIRRNGAQRHLEVGDVIALSQQGVSEPVITALQQAPIGQAVAPVPAPVYRTAPPVIVEEHHYAPVVPYHYRSHRYHRHYYRRPRSGASWGISFGN